MRRFFLKSIVILSFFLFACHVFAQSSAGLNIKPAIIEDNVNPGEEYSFVLKVTNIGDEKKTFYLLARDIKGLTEDGLPIFAQEEESTVYELSSWVVLPEESLTLDGGEMRELKFSVQVPENASPGAHFGGVFLSFRPPKFRETGSGIGYEVGTIMHLRISGEVIEEASLREFSTEKMIYSLPKINFKSTIENLGNVLIRPRGILEVTNMWNKEIASIRINDNGAPVFPSSERVFNFTWDHDGFTFGRHQAVLSFVYGQDSRKTISGTVSFWVLPLKPLAILLGSLFTFVFLVFVMTRIYIRKKLRDMSELSNARSSNKRDLDVYYRRHKASLRLTIITIALLVFLIVFLVGLFFLFA